ncbi:MAG: WD40/YVTN/BNR-like repeat-containing protein [Bacteroidales bacterium]
MKKHITIIITLILLILTVSLYGQQDSPSELWLNPASSNFSSIQQSVNQYFSGKDKGRGTGYTQWRRWEYYNQSRLTPDGKITNVTARNWEAYLRELQRYSQNGVYNPLATNGFWQSLGPTNYTNLAGWNPGVGRINVIAFHPANSNIFWLGMPSGGLWKTTTGGTSWIPLTDGMPRIGVSGIAVDYNNTDIMYILTGDGDGGDTKSIGVLKTVNGGVTWLSTGLSWIVSENVRGYKLAIHPGDPGILFAVTTEGIYKTTNSGLNWTLVLAGSYRDLEFKPGDPTCIYVSGASSFHRSLNTGDTWTQIVTGVPTGCQRIALGVSPAASAYVYLFAGPPTGIGSFKGFYLSTNSGGSFSTRSTTPNVLGYSSTGNDDAHQTGYDLAMAVSRTASANVIVGGINTWTSANWGTTWAISSWWDTRGNTIGYTHADIHDLAINPLNNYLYCCSDGGIFRSTDFGLNWTDLTPGIANTQWYRIAGIESNYNLLVGGTQDNGSNKWTGSTTMSHLRGADGMDAMIDHSNANIFYTTRYDGILEKTTDAGSTWSGIQPAGSSGTWVTPLIMDPSNSSIIYGGYTNVYKSINGGSTWTNMGASGSSAMAIGTSITSRVYAASGTSIWRSDNSGVSWTSISSGLPGIGITSIVVNPDASLNVFVTVGDYYDGLKVYSSTTGGASWTNISGTLPNVVVNCIAFEDNNAAPDAAVYIGTDIGIYYRNATIGDWVPFMNGLPTVPVSDLVINKTSGLIRAATYGRGLWTSALYSACPSGYVLNTGNDPSNPNYTGFQFYQASDYITSSRVITGGLGTDVTYKSANYIKLETGFNAKENNMFKATLGPCQATAPPVKGIYGGHMSK